MSRVNEGYLCPECFLNLDSESSLRAHFEKKHGESVQQTTVNHVTEYYKGLITGDAMDNNSPKSMRIENVFSLLLDGKLTCENTPEITLKPKIQAFLKSQLERELMVSQLSTELESAKQSNIEGYSESQSAELKAEIETHKHEIQNLRHQRDVNEQVLQCQYNWIINLKTDLANLAIECEKLKTERQEIKSLLSLNETEGISFVNQIKIAFNNLKLRSPDSQNAKSNAAGSGDTSDLVTEISSLKAQLANLQLEKNDLEEKSTNQEPLEELLMELQKEVSSLKDQLEEKKSLENQIRNMKLNEEAFRRDVESFKSSLQNSNSTVEKLLVENSDLIKQIDKFKSAEASSLREMESLKTSLGKSNCAITELQGENAGLTAKIAALSSEVESKKQEIAGISRSLADANDASKQKDSSIEALSNEVKECMRSLEVKSKECDQLAQRIESLSSTITQLSEKANDAEARLVSSLESENALKRKLIDAEATLTTQRTALETHESTVAELESKLTSTLAENQTLIDQIIEGQSKSEQLESALAKTHKEMDKCQQAALDLGRQNLAFQIQIDRLTNRQWVSDDAVVACTNCNREFTISIRKHHCRHCGKVFCNACSSKKTATAASKDPQRVCDACFSELTGSR